MALNIAVRSPAAIIGGAVAASAAIALLMRDGFASGFTIEHGLMPALVGLTVLAAHLGFQRIAKLSGIPLLFLAGFGSALIVYETMGRRAELRDTKTATAAAKVQDRTDLKAEIAEYRRATALARQKEARACANPRNKGLCKSRGADVAAFEAHIAEMTAELDGMQVVPVDAKADRVAAVAAIFGATGDVKAAVGVFDPFAFPLFLEMASILLFGIGFGGEQVKKAYALPPADGEKKPQPKPAAPKFPRPVLISAPEVEDYELAALRAFFAVGDGPVSVTNDELARGLNLSKSEASKRVSKAVAAGILQRQRVGREVAIRLN
jgi:hypothetical protein